MADRHPYVSAPGGLVQVITHFRRSLPQTVTAETLRKLGYAPKNESYVLNVLRHLGLIDKDGLSTTLAQKIFSQHDDAAFSRHLAEAVQQAYSGLFELHQDHAWSLDQEALITFFRSSDQTTAIVGKRQASTFQILAGFAGHGDVPKIKQRRRDSSKEKVRSGKIVPPTSRSPQSISSSRGGDLTERKRTQTAKNIGLTVRIEVNLPSDGDQDTYDRIFRSIREYILNG
jgi:hypothetical protein